VKYGEKILTIMIFLALCGFEDARMLKTRLKQTFGSVSICFGLLKAIFQDFLKFLSILFDFLLSKIFFERVECGLNFCMA
jgi:hypothetical protein